MRVGGLELRECCSRRAVAAAGVATLAALAIAALPQLLGPEVTAALRQLDDARPEWLWAAGLAFVAALAANGLAWRAAVEASGGRLTRADAVARYGIGSLVNAAAPARLGDAVRIALFSRAFDGRERLWTTGGVFGAIGAARSLCLGALVLVAALAGALPLWPVLVLAGLASVGIAVAVAARGTRAGSRVSHLLDAFRGLGRSPRSSARLLGWIGCATAARVLGVAAIAAALGVDAPLTAAAILVPALDLAGLMPLTPGNFALGSGTVAVALQAQGVELTTALSTAIALHAAETAASIGVGLLGALFLAQVPAPGVRRWRLRLAGTAAGVAVAAAFGATVLAPLV